MKGIEYGRQRKKAAKELGVNAGDLDREVKAYRKSERDAVPLFSHWQTTIWPEPVDSNSLLRAIINRIQRFVVCTPNQALLATLWVMFSWVHEGATHSPILVATSAEPELGKSTLLGVIAFLTQRSITTIEISPAALYRSIDRWNPSFIVDEFDTVLAADDKSELRAIINAGHTPESKIIRCVEPDYMPTAFSPFCPKALGLIGLKMPAATLGRSIIIRLKRRKTSQTIEEFGHADDTQSQDLRGRLLRWSEDNAEALAKAVPIMPNGFSNRRANNYRLLFAIADSCGLDWDEKARIAAAQVEGAVDTSGVKITLLRDVKRIFEADGVDRIFSKALCARLGELEESPWSTWSKGKEIVPRQLTALLSDFEIYTRTVHLSETLHNKGYVKTDFEDAWATYLPPENFTFGQGG